MRTPLPVKAVRACPCGAKVTLQGQPLDLQAMLRDWGTIHEQHEQPDYMAARARERYGAGLPDDLPIVVIDTPNGGTDGRDAVSNILWPHYAGKRYRNPVASAEQRGVPDGVFLLVPLT